ncbi:MAG: hypothetical protein ACK5L0_04730 [Candidatus Fimivivens sp.]
MRFKSILKAITYLIVGFWCGLFVAQGFIVLALRNGGSPGGELVPLFAIPLALYAGYIMGDDLSREKWFAAGYRKGATAPWNPTVQSPLQTVNQDKQA